MVTNMTDISPTILIILDVNGLNTPNKRQKLAEWIKNNNVQLYGI